MMFTSHALLSGIALYVSAASAATWQINVSNATAGLVFNPNNITAAVGDTVEFIFNPKNHSVTQSSFAQPCTPLSGGFDTGFLPVTNGTDNSSLPTRQFVVNDTQPIWIHCRQSANTAGSHCGKGMVFAVNPGANGSNNSFANFQATALAIGTQLAANSTNTTTPSGSGSGSTPQSTGGIGGSSSNGAIISVNIDGANAMLMAGLGMVVSLMA
ncbi:Cupredoxin [Russula decolorans]